MSARRPLATADEIAEVLAESLTTVRRNTRRGEYKAFAVNLGTDQRPKWRYDLQRLERWLDLRRSA
ncbi:hypothetical protein [Janibacter sp. LM]|uniref:hypothetical protein n=1 Tax=Janibacter sp. LM TaxID=3144845 RepID=UPI0031F6DE65